MNQQKVAAGSGPHSATLFILSVSIALKAVLFFIINNEFFQNLKLSSKILDEWIRARMNVSPVSTIHGWADTI